MTELAMLLAGTMLIYLLVLSAHGLRHRYGLALFYATLGGLTAIMAWTTDTGLALDVNGIRFVIGSTVFYTALMLGVFVIYVFEGPAATRIAILAVLGMSILTPLTLAAMRFALEMTGNSPASIPAPGVRLNAASALTTLIDFVFLAIVWEYLGKLSIDLRLGVRAFLTLLGVMCLDVLLFATAAFAGTPGYLAILAGTLSSRLLVAVFAFPFLYGYLRRESTRKGVAIEQRPVFAILRQLEDTRHHLGLAEQEIERRRQAEAERDASIARLQSALAEVKALRGLLPICMHCKKVRDDQGYWSRIEAYIEQRTDARFTHGICGDCVATHYPEMLDEINAPEQKKV
ncbi:MAG: hypothetical protein CALGDGBN_02857 [Pseudomonadales bacterium]|nr:hypothetical protein [Pseudomonadales bacterium]